MNIVLNLLGLSLCLFLLKYLKLGSEVGWSFVELTSAQDID